MLLWASTVAALQITQTNVFGCRDQGDYVRALQLAHDRSSQFESFIMAKFASGECIMWRVGQDVDMTKSEGGLRGLVRLRPVGGTAEYWTSPAVYH